MKAGTERVQWAVFSDTHGNSGAMRSALASDRFDAIAHLGDGVAEASALAREAGIPLHAVSGNEDGAADYPETRSVTFGADTAFLIHGHRLDLNPYQGPDRWQLHFASMEALMVRHVARLLFFGHTHVPVLTSVTRGIICNPGSMYHGSNRPHTFAVAQSHDGTLTVRLMRQDGHAWIMDKELSLEAAPRG
ncbi:MAG TPA: metallophosphoesterase family protein [Spirochaetota bacterium]|nr:metallophosphoesterase family protein [Spirochaetota bacterium]HPG51826.1 metallophosphoesterase family protein [Spirochaetota bacterium]HPN11386.1 metallophosphoesterase family protein [Spirochaetota bacterium]